MSDKNEMALYTAVYQDVPSALADLEEIDRLHGEQLIGKYDAAVVDLEEGKPHIVKRMDRPRIRIIPEQMGGGTLPSKELKEAAEGLRGNEAGLILVGEPTIEKGFEKAVQGSAKVIRRDIDATTDQISRALQEAEKEVAKAEKEAAKAQDTAKA